MNAERAYKNFFKGLTGFPKFKRKGKSRDSFYLIGTLKVERHRIFLPTLKWVKLKEYGYIPKNMTSVTVSKEGGRYFVSCLVKEDKDDRIATDPDLGIGIDLGIKDLAILSTGTRYENINKTSRIRRLEKSLKRQQKSLSRKLESNMFCKTYDKKGKLKSFKWQKPLNECSNFQKQNRKIARLHKRLTAIRTDYINQSISQIVNQKPKFITIEDLNIRGMMKNKHLSKAIANQKLFYFITRLTQKCDALGIELRKVNRFYPSSKLCSTCGNKNTSLKLYQREWTCTSCGMRHDRDLNASINLKQARNYQVIV